MNIARVKDTCPIRFGILALCVILHKGHILGKLVLLVLVHHSLHVTLVNDSASIQRTCSTDFDKLQLKNRRLCMLLLLYAVTFQPRCCACHVTSTVMLTASLCHEATFRQIGGF